MISRRSPRRPLASVLAGQVRIAARDELVRTWALFADPAPAPPRPSRGHCTREHRPSATRPQRLQCRAGQGPNAARTACQPCGWGEYSPYGICLTCQFPNVVVRAETILSACRALLTNWPLPQNTAKTTCEPELAGSPQPPPPPWQQQPPPPPPPTFQCPQGTTCTRNRCRSASDCAAAHGCVCPNG